MWEACGDEDIEIKFCSSLRQYAEGKAISEKLEDTKVEMKLPVGHVDEKKNGKGWKKKKT